MPTKFLIPEEDLQPGETLKFEYNQMGVSREGFLARLQDGWVAFENRCRHIPISLDLDNNQFFTPDQDYFFCQSHGALYETTTGKCVQGPCAGAQLFKIPLTFKQGMVGIETDEPI